MHLHHYTPNRVVILQDGRTLCAVCADVNHTRHQDATNDDVYARAAAKRLGRDTTPSGDAILREFVTTQTHADCSTCGQEC